MKYTFEVVLGIIFSFLIIAFSQVSFAGRCDTLKPGQAAFFEHGKYKGACVVRKIGRYSNSRAVGIGNDKISSIKVGSRTQVRLCKDNNFRGGCKTYTRSTPSLGRMNDKTSSAIIDRIIPTKNTSIRCTPNANQVAVFEDINFKGACAVLGEGNYKNSSEIGVANDTISSVLVGGNYFPNVAIMGYKDTNFRSMNFFSTGNVHYMRGPKSINPLKGLGNPLKGERIRPVFRQAYRSTKSGGDAISSIKVIKICK